MHTKPLIDFVISEGKRKISFSNIAPLDYQFIDNCSGPDLAFLSADRVNKVVPAPEAR